MLLTKMERVFEIGAGSAGLTAALLAKLQVSHYFANDLVPESAELVEKVTRRHEVATTEFLAGDIEQLNIPQQLDLIISGATVQWLDDLRTFFKRTAAALTGGGRLCFSSFGPDNMQEIKTLTSIGLNYLNHDQLRTLAEPWFDVEVMTEEIHTLDFPTPAAVLKHISKTGVSGVNQSPWTRSQHRSFVERYLQHYSTAEGVQLTYHCLYCCLKKKAIVTPNEQKQHWNDDEKDAELEIAHGW